MSRGNFQKSLPCLFRSLNVERETVICSYSSGFRCPSRPLPRRADCPGGALAASNPSPSGSRTAEKLGDAKVFSSALTNVRKALERLKQINSKDR